MEKPHCQGPFKQESHKASGTEFGIKAFRRSEPKHCLSALMSLLGCLQKKKSNLYSLLLCLLEEKDLYLQSNNNRKLLMVIDFFLDQETGQPWMAMILTVLGKEKENAVIYRKQLRVAPRHLEILDICLLKRKLHFVISLVFFVLFFFKEFW